MTLQAQSGEDRVVLNYFGPHPGRFLDLGAYDGVSCSNTHALVEAGWGGVLVEGGIAAFRDLARYHGGKQGVELVHAVVAATDAAAPLIEWWENAAERQGGYQAGWWPGLGSTTLPEQRARMIEIYGAPENWRRYWVVPLTMPQLLQRCPGPYQFITIDTEGSSVAILCDLDLGALGTRAVCVEHNARTDHTAHPGPADYHRARAHCAAHGLTVQLFDNGVNAIFARPVG